MQIAIYGKGGIGKSTISANLSAALALRGQRVLQIGCDPKHDSTRLLHHGQKVRTVLDYILNTPEDDQKPGDILMDGYMGCGCVEAGGPRPGMGCAGRGILTSFEFLNKFKVLDDYETVVYDVLGDVVCGGFAVPVRPQYAKAVFLVTSGEAMSLYAANNILQGIKNLDGGAERIAGIIFNSRGPGEDRSRVFDFAEETGLPVCVSIPRSEAFMRAEKTARTVVEAEPDGVEAGLFLSLADMLIAGAPLFTAKPLDEERMERFMRGENNTGDGPLCHFEPGEAAFKAAPGEKNECSAAPEAAAAPAPVPAKKRALSDPFSRVPLFGCAYRGAVDLAVHVKDAAVLGHAPKSCTWYAVNGITGYSRRGLFDRGVLYPAFIPQHFSNTDITVQDAVFGGVEHARQKALELVKDGVRTVIAVTACIPGLCGDDLEPVKQELAGMGAEMYIVHTDGVEAGDYNEGMALCYKTLAQEAVRPDVEPEPDLINIVYEQTWSAKTDDNFQKLKAILDGLGIAVNCRFLTACSIEDIHGFLKAPYSLMARGGKLGEELKGIFESRYGCRFMDGTLPRGFSHSAEFARQLGRLYGREAQAEALIESSRAAYLREMEQLKETFGGKRTMIFLSEALPWLSEAAKDLGLDIVYEFAPGASGSLSAGWNHRFSADWEKDTESFRDAVAGKRPELVLLSDPSVLPDCVPGTAVITVPREIGVGFSAGAEEVRRWIKLAGPRPEGRWKHDKDLFEKYYC